MLFHILDFEYIKKVKKNRSESSIEDLSEHLKRGTNVISKRTVNSVVNAGCAVANNTVGDSDLDCNFPITRIVVFTNLTVAL